MTVYKLCTECGEHECEREAELCRFCLPAEESDAVIPVDVQFKRSQGRRILEGFEFMKNY